MIKKILPLFYILILLCIPLQAKDLKKDENHAIVINYNCLEQLHENIYLHLNRNSIVVGERLYFKAYIINKLNLAETKSKILYIELVDSHNKLKASCRSNIDSSSCESSIVIPDSLSTGLYKIFAYTNLMRNFPSSSFLRSSLIIIGMKNEPENNLKVINNPNESIDTGKLYTNQSNQNFSSNLSTDIVLTAESDKQVYNRKQKVAVLLTLKDSDLKPLHGNFSISVSEKIPEYYSDLNPDISEVMQVISGDTGSMKYIPYNHRDELKYNIDEYKKWLAMTKEKSYLSMPYMPENNSFILGGTLFDKSTHKVEIGKTIFLSTPDSLANLKYSITDSTGRFLFALDKTFDNRKLIINVDNLANSKEYNITLDNKQINDSTKPFGDFKNDNILNEFFLKSKKIALINRVYDKPNILKKTIQLNNMNSNFYGIPDYTIRLADYIELNDFFDISKNLLPAVKFKKKKNDYSIIIRDYHNSILTWSDNCLVLLNNIPFYDYDYLSTLGSNQIDRIEVNCEHIAYGNIEFYGILSIHTKDKILIPNKQALVFDNKVENSSNQILQNDASGTKLKQMPSFKQNLFWKPDLVLDKAGKVKLEFFTSDLAAEYIVDFEGITDNGTPVTKKIKFVVQ